MKKFSHFYARAILLFAFIAVITAMWKPNYLGQEMLVGACMLVGLYFVFAVWRVVRVFILKNMTETEKIPSGNKTRAIAELTGVIDKKGNVKRTDYIQDIKCEYEISYIAHGKEYRSWITLIGDPSLFEKGMKAEILYDYENPSETELVQLLSDE